MERPPLDDLTELDYRYGDAIEVFLHWHKRSNTLWIALTDHKEETYSEFQIPNDKALEAFHHPFVWRNRHGAEVANG